MSAEPTTLFPLPVPVLAKTAPLRTAIRDEVQDRALDGVGAYSSAVGPWLKSRSADEKHDRCLTQSRLCFSRGEYAMADYWVEQAQLWDSREDALLDRVWELFAGAADACRHIVAWVESLLARRSPARATGKGSKG